MWSRLLGPSDTAWGKQNRIIWFGLIAMMGSQYVWLLPIPYGTETCTAVGIACVVVVVAWKVIELLRPRSRS